jgi:hypothetical protein
MKQPCAICHDGTTVPPGDSITAGAFRDLLARGFRPSPRAQKRIARMTGGMSPEQVVENWRHWANQVVDKLSGDWRLCPRCAADVRSFTSPSNAGSAEARRWWQFWKK